MCLGRSGAVTLAGVPLDTRWRVWFTTRMSTTDPYRFERETDEKLRDLYVESYLTRQKLDLNARYLLDATNPVYYYRGKQRVTDRTFTEALGMLTEALAKFDAEHPHGSSDLARLESLVTPGDFRHPAPYASRVRDLLAEREELRAKIEDLAARTAKLDELYTGWSRFYVVGGGHIHSTMECSTCYPTTLFGWLPELSGHEEREAVAACGPMLCSVCFPTAPVDHQGGTFTQAEAEKIAKGGLKVAREIRAKKEKAAKSVCPGSGKQMIEPSRTGFAYGNWGTCPDCHERVALTTSYGPNLRKHNAPQAVTA